MAQEIIGDAQTTITSGLLAGFGGRISGIISAYLNKMVGLEQPNELGSDLLVFAVDAISSSLVYYAIARYAPQTASNVYFSYIFFSADEALTNSTMRVVDRVLSGIEGGRRSSAPRQRGSGGVHVAQMNPPRVTTVSPFSRAPSIA